MKPEVKKIKEFLEKVSIFLAQHTFLTCLFLFFLSLIFGGFLFYKYIILTQKIEPESFGQLQLEEKIYQDILAIWQEEERKFIEADLKEYPNLFRKPVVKPEEENFIEEELTE